MYYLYQKKQQEEGPATSAVGASSAVGQPVTVHSQSSSQHDHHDHHNIDTNIDNDGTSANQSISSGGPPVPRRPGLNRRGRPGAESESDESKQKDEQLVRRMMRRRGLEEHEFTEEVMQPRRPQRVACQRCQQDITTNDSRHRIMCTGPENHVFCKCCVIDYVEGWMKGESSCELRQNKAGPLTGVYALPCLFPSCQHGCFTEAHLQPLVTNPMFVAVRQRISFERSRENRGRPLRAVLTTPESASSQPLPRELSQDDYLQASHSLAPPPLLHRQQQHHYQHDNHTQPTQLHRPSYEHQTNPQRLAQEHDNQQYQRQQFQFQHHHQHSMQHQQHDQHQLMQQQQMLLEHRQHQQMLDQQQSMLQDHRHNAPGPLPPALRRTSTASTAKTTTTKSVRFSIKEDMDGLLDDLASVGSSNSSLTTRFPVSLNDQQQSSDEDPSEDEHQLHPQQLSNLPQEQLTSQDQSTLHVSVQPSFFTCQCCYEEFDATKSLKTSCDPRKPSTESHIFCGKCFRLYIEEWLFGQATYALRPGMSTSGDGKTVLVVPCLFGDCKGGGFSDKRVSQSLSPRMMGQYLEKISSLRVDEEEQEEKLVKMAIRLSLEQDEIQKKVNRMLDDQQSLTKEGIPVRPPSTEFRHMHLPPSELHVHMADLSCASSLTSFNTAFQHTTVSAPGLGSMKYANSKVATSTKKLATKRQSLHEQRVEKLEKCVHDVEEAMTSAKIRQCPNCNTKFLKDKDFCNKLKCPSCKTAICYICRNVIPTQGYEHFCIHKQGGCGDCLGLHCPLWTVEGDDDRRDLAAMRARGLDEANRIWENSLTDGQLGVEIRVDVDKLLQQPAESDTKHMGH